MNEKKTEKLIPYLKMKINDNDNEASAIIIPDEYFPAMQEFNGEMKIAFLLDNDINFDYAFTPYEFSLGETHTISLMYSF